MGSTGTNYVCPHWVTHCPSRASQDGEGQDTGLQHPRASLPCSTLSLDTSFQTVSTQLLLISACKVLSNLQLEEPIDMQNIFNSWR